MPLTPEDLRQIAERTLAHYDQRARDFWEGTRDHDVSQNIGAMLQHIETAPPFELLDFGCGPGRDLRTFKALGHRACEVLEQNFLELELPDLRFDGVFANAVLFHVPRQELSRVLGQLHATLKANGVLFSSNPRGSDEEGWNGDRYGAFHDWESWRYAMTTAGFVELTHYYRPPGLPRAQQPWLASVWRKSAAPARPERPAPAAR
jgi:SAM-dependent methyltransferase